MSLYQERLSIITDTRIVKVHSLLLGVRLMTKSCKILHTIGVLVKNVGKILIRDFIKMKHPCQ